MNDFSTANSAVRVERRPQHEGSGAGGAVTLALDSAGARRRRLALMSGGRAERRGGAIAQADGSSTEMRDSSAYVAAGASETSADRWDSPATLQARR
jgi:hypothetical protein